MCTVVGDQTTNYAQMVKLVDTRDLKSLGLNIRAGSTPALGTTPKKMLQASFFILALPKNRPLRPHLAKLSATPGLSPNQALSTLSLQSKPTKSHTPSSMQLPCLQIT